MDYFIAHWWLVSKEDCKDYRALYPKINDTELYKKIRVIQKNVFGAFWAPDTWMINAKTTNMPDDKSSSNEIMLIEFNNRSCEMSYTGR